jgi:hypothetical protein
VNTNDLSGSKFLTGTKWHIKMELTPLEGELQFCLWHAGDVIPATATRGANVDVAVKWRLNQLLN